MHLLLSMIAFTFLSMATAKAQSYEDVPEAQEASPQVLPDQELGSNPEEPGMEDESGVEMDQERMDEYPSEVEEEDEAIRD